MYRSKVDRICTRGMMLAADLVDRLPVAGHDEGKAPIESSGGVRRAVTHS
jgi:hypothetical protein